MADTNELQLERAEFQNPAEKATCAMCSKPLYRHYYQVNESSVCAVCCGRVRNMQSGEGSVKRGVVAAFTGLAAAAAGSTLYYGILAMTGYEFALIAIVVGFAVGKAVHWGSEGRGGWLYQTMAVALTYLAIVSAYVPMIFTELGNQEQMEIATAADGAALDIASAPVADPIAAPVPVAETVETEAAPAIDAQPIGLGGALFALGVLAALIVAAPFLAGFSNIIGIIIIGIGVFEAWKINRRIDFVITGPHALALAAPPAPAPAAAT